MLSYLKTNTDGLHTLKDALRDWCEIQGSMRDDLIPNLDKAKNGKDFFEMAEIAKEISNMTGEIEQAVAFLSSLDHYAAQDVVRISLVGAPIQTIYAALEGHAEFLADRIQSVIPNVKDGDECAWLTRLEIEKLQENLTKYVQWFSQTEQMIGALKTVYPELL